MQKLEFSYTSASADNQEGETAADSFVQQSILAHMTDCVEIYKDRQDTAAGQSMAADLVPERVVPLVLDASDPQYLTEIDISCKNEQGEDSGRFGWCITCRKAADYYCKDSRFPICSPECKVAYIKAEQNFDRKALEENKTNYEKKKQAISDCISMFKSFMRHAFQPENR